MVDLTPFLPGLSPVQGKAVVARFDGGRLSSEGGLLALREIERRLGLSERLASCLVDPRAPERVVHRLAEIIRFRMLMIAAGYEDGNDADRLRGTRCLSWRWIVCRRAKSCARNRRSRGWKTSPTDGLCCALGGPSSSSIAALSARRRSALSSISTTPSTACMAASNYACSTPTTTITVFSRSLCSTQRAVLSPRCCGPASGRAEWRSAALSAV